MPTLWDKVKINFEKMTDTALELAREAAQKTKEQAAIATIKLDLAKTEREITKNLAKIGDEVVCQLKEKGNIAKNETIEKLFNEIKELEKKLEENKRILENNTGDRSGEKKQE